MRLRVHADVAAAHAAGLANLREDVADDVARSGKADALVAARLRVDERADADQRPSVSTSAPPLLPGIDRRVGLDVDHRVVGRELPRHGADDARA